MVLAQPFSTASPVLANYDWTDVAEGTGVIRFYGSSEGIVNAGAEDFVLKKNAGYTYSKSSAAQLSAATATKEYERDFDLNAFKQARTIEGSSTIFVRGGAYNGNAGDSTSNEYLIIKVRKWDGTTETEIANVQSATITQTNVGQKYQNFILPLTIPRTHFAVGETLRITIEAWGWQSALTPANSSIQLYHDPLNEDGAATSAGNEQLIFDIPFRIEI